RQSGGIRPPSPGVAAARAQAEAVWGRTVHPTYFVPDPGDTRKYRSNRSRPGARSRPANSWVTHGGVWHTRSVGGAASYRTSGDGDPVLGASSVRRSSSDRLSLYFGPLAFSGWQKRSSMTMRSGMSPA